MPSARKIVGAVAQVAQEFFDTQANLDKAIAAIYDAASKARISSFSPNAIWANIRTGLSFTTTPPRIITRSGKPCRWRDHRGRRRMSGHCGCGEAIQNPRRHGLQ